MASITNKLSVMIEELKNKNSDPTIDDVKLKRREWHIIIKRT